MISVQQQTAQKYQTHLSPKSIRTKFFENGTLSKVFHTKLQNPEYDHHQYYQHLKTFEIITITAGFGLFFT